MKKGITALLGILLLVAGMVIFLIPRLPANAASGTDMEIKNGILISYSGSDANVTIPDTVSVIGPEAFKDSKIETITIPSTVRKVSDHAFYGCSKLYRAVIQDGVQELGKSAFANCESLDKVILPASVTKIGAGIFSGCMALGELELSSDNTRFFYNDGVLYNHDSTELIQYLPGRKATGYEMPFTVKTIDAYAFWGAELLTNVDISNQVKEIGPYAFQGCNGLRSIYLPESVTKIGVYAFADCENLTYVGMEAAQVAIAETAFSGDSDELVRENSAVKGSTVITSQSSQPADTMGDGAQEEAAQKAAIPNRSTVPGTDTIQEIDTSTPDNLLGATRIVNGNALVILSENKVK